jgi:hypothetical protein
VACKSGLPWTQSRATPSTLRLPTIPPGSDFLVPTIAYGCCPKANIFAGGPAFAKYECETSRCEVDLRRFLIAFLVQRPRKRMVEQAKIKTWEDILRTANPARSEMTSAVARSGIA